MGEELIKKPDALIASPQESLEFVDKFISDQQIKENSQVTYRQMINLYLKWVTDNKLLLSQLQRHDLILFREYLINDSGLGMSSVALCITVVRSFYRWLESMGQYPDIARHIKPPKTKKGFKKLGLVKNQVIELLEWASNHQTKRDRAIIYILVYCGLRLIEVVRANIEDITLKYNERIIKIHGKGRDEKDDFVVMVDDCYNVIKDYLMTVRQAYSGSQPLFTSISNINRGKRLTTRSLMNITNEALEGIGLFGKEYTAHSLRHSCAQNILDAGGTIENVQWVLRHADQSTTQNYTDAIKDRRRTEQAPEKLLQGYFKKQS